MSDASKVAVNTAGPYIAHTDLQTTEAQARTSSPGGRSRPTGILATVGALHAGKGYGPITFPEAQNMPIVYTDPYGCQGGGM